MTPERVQMYGRRLTAQDAIAQWHGGLRSRIEDDARTSPDVWKTVNCSTKG